MDSLIFSEQMGFWNSPCSPGDWRIVACLRQGRNPGPRGEIASVLSWNNPQALRHVAAMLGLDPEAEELPGALSASACARSLALGAAKACSEAFGGGWAEAPHSSPRLSSDSSTSRFIVFDQHDLAAMAAGFESLAASSGGSVRHSHDGLAHAARELSASGPPALLVPALFCSARFAIDPKADLFWASDSQGARHRVDGRALACALGLPSACALAQADPDLGLPPSFLDMDAIKRRAADLGDAAFGLGCSLRFNPQSDKADDDFAVSALQALQEARLLSASLQAEVCLHKRPSRAPERRAL